MPPRPTASGSSGRRTRDDATPGAAFAIVGFVAALAGAVGAIALRIVDPVPLLPGTFGFGVAALGGFELLGLTFALGRGAARGAPARKLGRLVHGPHRRRVRARRA